MIKLLTLSATLLLAVSASQGSLAQGRGEDKPGKVKDGGSERSQGHKDHPGKGNGNDKKEKHRNGEGRDRDRLVEVSSTRERDRNPERDKQGVGSIAYRGDGLIQGCPPGLAKKNNGCLPPGQAKKAQRARYDFRSDQTEGGVVRRYDAGYQYHYDRQGSLLGYAPALGGALSAGSAWPTKYPYDSTPRYQADYYGLKDANDYRYADGAIYSVDPKTAVIKRVVALVTGQSAAVGQPLPRGYDIYNVPQAYRDQYVDTASAAYRYNDGAIYKVDPKTQVVTSIIQLLTQK